MNKPSFLLRAFYAALVLSLLAFGSLLLFYGATRYDWHDFDVFYFAAKSALAGKSIYIIVGQYNLPFWYFPWAAWFYIPFAIWPHDIGLALYKASSLLAAIFVLWVLTRYYDPNFKILDRLLIFALLIPMSTQLMQVGQMDYILLALIVATIFAANGKMDILTGVILPFIWIKPHLVIIFTIFAMLRAGRHTVAVSAALVVIMLLLQTLLNPGWHLEMLEQLRVGSQRIDGLQFTTFPSLIGFQENWVGTGNLPFTIALILFALGTTWHFRSLPTVPFLSLALTASLFCAPRAYAYDLPLLIPSMIWLTYKDFRKNAWIWFAVAMIPLVSVFGSTSFLATLLVYGLSLWKAYQSTQQKDHEAEIQANPK